MIHHREYQFDWILIKYQYKLYNKKILNKTTNTNTKKNTNKIL